MFINNIFERVKNKLELDKNHSHVFGIIFSCIFIVD